MFILQTVSVQWTKRSRSAPFATIRNRLPRLLPLPDTVLECEYGCHSQHYQESHSDNGSVTFLVYEPKFSIMQTLPAELDNGFGLIQQDNRLTVYFTDQRGERKPRRRLFVLADGQTAQLRTNLSYTRIKHDRTRILRDLLRRRIRRLGRHRYRT
jgi:hypothetical protein